MAEVDLIPIFLSHIFFRHCIFSNLFHFLPLGLGPLDSRYFFPNHRFQVTDMHFPLSILSLYMSDHFQVDLFGSILLFLFYFVFLQDKIFMFGDHLHLFLSIVFQLVVDYFVVLESIHHACHNFLFHLGLFDHYLQGLQLLLHRLHFRSSLLLLGLKFVFLGLEFVPQSLHLFYCRFFLLSLFVYVIVSLPCRY